MQWAVNHLGTLLLYSRSSCCPQLLAAPGGAGGHRQLLTRITRAPPRYGRICSCAAVTAACVPMKKMPSWPTCYLHREFNPRLMGPGVTRAGFCRRPRPG